jgi:hypothetical protein
MSCGNHQFLPLQECGAETVILDRSNMSNAWQSHTTSTHFAVTQLIVDNAVRNAHRASVLQDTHSHQQYRVACCLSQAVLSLCLVFVILHSTNWPHTSTGATPFRHTNEITLLTSEFDDFSISLSFSDWHDYGASSRLYEDKDDVLCPLHDKTWSCMKPFNASYAITSPFGPST